jgi:hypothetical protein
MRTSELVMGMRFERIARHQLLGDLAGERRIEAVADICLLALRAR